MEGVIMKHSGLLLGLGVMTLALNGCADNQAPMPLRLPADQLIVQKKTQASIQPKEKYFLAQVQLEATSESDLLDVMDDLKAKKNMELTVLDKVPNENIFLMEIQSL